MKIETKHQAWNGQQKFKAEYMIYNEDWISFFVLHCTIWHVMNPIFVLYGEACNQIRCLLAPPPTLNPLLPKKNNKNKNKTKQNKTTEVCQGCWSQVIILTLTRNKGLCNAPHRTSFAFIFSNTFTWERERERERERDITLHLCRVYFRSVST